MSKWIDFSIDERKAMIQGVVVAKNIDEAAAEKDWWSTAILYADMALSDSKLYHDIVEHRKKFYHLGYVDYNKELPSSITIVPSEELIHKYEVDYNDMCSSFIYGETLSFADLLKFLETLQERFRKVPPIQTNS